MLDGSSISVVLDAYRPERRTLVELLGGLGRTEWQQPTECPAYDVKGIAAHVLGDDLSLLSRQRDQAVNGISYLRGEMPGVDFGTLLDSFNDRWVTTIRFVSPELLMQLLDLTGEWTAAYYEAVDPQAPGESVRLFGAPEGSDSPFWQAIAREYLERWIHHSQIRRSLGRPSLADHQFLEPGVEIAAAIAHLEPGRPTSPGDTWTLGPITLGSSQQAADILTRAHGAEAVRGLVTGPADVVELFAAAVGRP